MCLINKLLLDSINLLYICHLLFKKHLSLCLVHDLIMAGCTAHFGEHAFITWAAQPSEAHFIDKCKTARRKWILLKHTCSRSGRKREWKGMERQGEPPSEITAKWQLAVWRSLLGREKAQGACLKAGICEDMSKRRDKCQVGWPILSLWLYCTSGNFITAERMGGKECFNWHANTDGLRYSRETCLGRGGGVNL